MRRKCANKGFKKNKDSAQNKKQDARDCGKSPRVEKRPGVFIEKNSHLMRRVLYIPWVLDITNI